VNCVAHHDYCHVAVDHYFAYDFVEYLVVEYLIAKYLVAEICCAIATTSGSRY